jgi:hypothetical protein
MATSAPLSTACRLMDYSVRLRACARPATEGPQFTLSVLLAMPLPVLRWLQRLHLTMPSSLVLPCAPLSRARQPQFPHQSGSNGVALSKLQHSLYATAWSFARPAPVRTFTTELAWAGSPQSPKSVIARWFIVICHRRTLTGWTISIMGCEIKAATKASTKVPGLFRRRQATALLNRALRRTLNRIWAIFDEVRDEVCDEVPEIWASGTSSR